MNRPGWGCAPGVVGGPKGLPPPVAFPFSFYSLFFCRKEKGRKERKKNWGIKIMKIIFMSCPL